MQPLVMQEWLYVLPRCPEWHIPDQAQHSSTARPLSQVRAGLWESFSRQLFAEVADFCGANQALCCWWQGRLPAPAPPSAALNESVRSPPALRLQSVSQSRGRETTCRAGFQASFTLKSERLLLTALVYLVGDCFFPWKLGRMSAFGENVGFLLFLVAEKSLEISLWWML